MKLRFLTPLFALLCSTTGWAFVANDSAKTITSDGSSRDTQAAANYVKAKDQDGWVLTIGEAGGSYEWPAEQLYELLLDTPRNFTVKGASPSNRPTIHINTAFIVSYAREKLITVKDIIFTAGSRQVTFFVRGSGPKAGFRFSNIKWVGDWRGQTMWIGDGVGQGPTNAEGPYGLIDNCEGAGQTTFNIYSNATASDGLFKAWRRPMDWGTEKAVYFEDCYFHNPNLVVGNGLTDAWNGGSFVFRHNVVENRVVLNHGSDHFGNHVHSAKKHEVMHNTFRLTAASVTAPWLVYLRGGTAAIFDNTFEVTGAGSSANHGIYWDYYRANSYAGMSSNYDRFYNPLNTTIAAGSNGQSLPQFTVHVADTKHFLDNPTDLVGPVYTRIAAGSDGAAMPQGTVHVDDTSEFPEAGVLQIGDPPVPGGSYDISWVDYTGKTSTTFTGCTVRYGNKRTMTTGDVVGGVPVGQTNRFNIFIENIKITTSEGVQTVRATGKTATTFTGVIGGTGVMSTGGAVTRASDYLGTQQSGTGTITALVAAGSNGAALPQATINVNDTAAFPASGSLLVNYDPITGTGTEVAYTGKTATSFTGCTGGTGTLGTGQLIGGKGQDPRWPNEIWGSMPIWQWNNRAITPGYGTPLTGKSVHDFIKTDRDIFIHDSQTEEPTNTGTWLDSYTEFEYPHPLRQQISGSPSSPPAAPSKLRVVP